METDGRPRIIDLNERRAKRPPLIERILKVTKKLHEAKDFQIINGRKEVYSYVDATKDAVSSNRMHPTRMMNELIRTTSIKPSEVLIDPLECDDWETFTRYMCEEIMLVEAYNKLPELWQRDDQRRACLNR